VNELLLKTYSRMPAPLRRLAATLRGYQLRSWRYGPETDALAEAALERDRWSNEQWRSWREERLGFVLARAARSVPFYREQWDARRRRGDRASPELLENWPVLEKESVRRSPRAFLADDCDSSRMFHEHTSGTTGTSLDLWWSRETVRAWYALFEARWRLWYGVSRRDRWAILGGQLVVPVARDRPPFWVWNAALNQLYMSSYHLAPEHVPAYMAAMRQHEVRYLFGYTSALHSLARSIIESRSDAGRSLGLAVVITNAEPALAYQRDAIEEAFGAPLRETYGMAEIVTAAGECEKGRLHLWPDTGVVELFDGATPVQSGAVGDLVCTGLVNADMPLVRYRVGDRARLDPDSSPCSCGRTLPRVAAIEGRIDDTLFTRDGRAVGRMDPVFKSRLAVREAQIVQRSLDNVLVRVVPAADFTAADSDAIMERIRERLGDVTVELEKVEHIPRTANGKLRAVVCELSQEELASVGAGRGGTA